MRARPASRSGADGGLCRGDEPAMNVPGLRSVVTAAAILTTTGLAGRGGQSTFKSGVEVVSFGVTVLDRRGAHVTDLTADDFEITEGGEEQTIAYFARGSDESPSAPLHLGLLFDTSGSMEQDLAFSRSAAIKFLSASTHAVDITLVDFDTDVRVARFADSDFARIVERIRRRRAEGLTALYDALGVYLHGAFDQVGRKVLVIYTDGGDTSSAQTYNDTLTLLRASDVTVYSVGFMAHTPAVTRLEDENRLRQIAEITGGQTFFPAAMKDLDAAYAKVLAEIQAQYTLGYLSNHQKRDGAWRRVDVRVTRAGLRNLTVRTRKGYFAPYQPVPR
jgi:Ca-activated chloride channel homolog